MRLSSTAADGNVLYRVEGTEDLREQDFSYLYRADDEVARRFREG